MDDVTVIDSASLLTPFERFDPGRVIVRNGVVEAAGRSSDIVAPAGASVVDLHDYTLAPGFIDTHIHGAGGADVMEGLEALCLISRVIAFTGVTTFLPTTVSAAPERISAAVKTIGALMASGNAAGALPAGIHLEGPFINPIKRGAHPAAHVLAPDPSNIALLQEWTRMSGGNIRLVTFAPELDGADRIFREAESTGFAVSMGHSNATESEAEQAVSRGVRYAVHTFNAMRGFTHRDPGIAGAILTDDRVFAEIIADGVHVAPAAVRMFARCKPRDRVLLVTDSTAAVGLPDGRYPLGEGKVIVKGGVCRNEEGQLAGSALRLDVALKNYMRWTSSTLQDALFGVTVNPAQALGLEGRGVITAGSRADFVVLDRQEDVAATVVGGRAVFQRQRFFPPMREKISGNTQ